MYIFIGIILFMQVLGACYSIYHKLWFEAIVNCTFAAWAFYLYTHRPITL